MKKIICKNCGAEYSENLSKCPYCNTMNKKGAYRSFRLQFSSFIDRLLGLQEKAEKTVSRTIVFALLRSFIIIFIVIGMAFLFSLFSNTNYYNDREYDEKTYEKIIWIENNLDKLNEAYYKNDYDTVSKMLTEKNSIAYAWNHYRSFELSKEFDFLMNDRTMSVILLRDMLYYLYYPDYFATGKFADEEEKAKYINNCEAIYEYLEAYGFDRDELSDIYNKHKDNYGYVSANDLDPYLKGANNG